MKITWIARAALSAASLALAAATFVATPALAQSECTCVLPAGGGGSISAANPDVFVSGGNKPQPAAAGTLLGPGSVVTTGPNGAAGINLGSSCSFSMAGSMSMQIVPQADGSQCVRVTQDSVTTGEVDGSVATAAGIAAGAGVVISLGVLLSVSK